MQGAMSEEELRRNPVTNPASALQELPVPHSDTN